MGSATPTWVSDITYIATKEGWLYLAVVLSIQTRQVLGYSLADRMPDDLVERAFINAWNACLGLYGVVFHSDQGRQYASSKFRFALAKKGFTQSMCRKGNSHREWLRSTPRYTAPGLFFVGTRDGC
ncbi:DDE-type integrase/transposase/recombinase [Pseudomonas sp. NPDC090233]|uniref:DDE-type integrase/transposase/recombinase n=1 Tax=Pseudomonas sp. NPDC090233 TaxID=3364479 RepID=UPI00383A6354